jgi:hypothetical protein
MCPRGDDPLTKDVDSKQITTTSLQVNEVQRITAQAVAANLNGGEVTFSYTDVYNGVWTTRPVVLPSVTALPNSKGKIDAMPFNWHPVKNTNAAFNVLHSATWGTTFAGTVADGTVIATVTAGTIAGFGAKQPVVASGVATGATVTGIVNDGIYQTTSTSANAGTKVELALVGGGTLPANANNPATTFTSMLEVTDVDIHASTGPQQTFKLSRTLTAAEAAGMRKGDQLLIHSVNNEFQSCVVTLDADATASTTFTGELLLTTDEGGGESPHFK